jgi:oligoendopeptidase F
MTEDTTMLRWDIDSFFKGGSRSKGFEEFRQTVGDDLKHAETAVSNLPVELDDKSRPGWIDLMVTVQDLDMRLDHAGSFAFCLQAQDVTDEHAMVIIQDLSSMEARLETVKTGIEELALSLDQDAWSKLLDDQRLRGSAFYWNERRSIATLKMEPKLEKLATRLAVDGYHAWNRLYSKIAGDLTADFEEDGGKKTLSMGQLSNRMSSSDRGVRRRAFEKLEEAWKTMDGLAALELNSIAGFRLSLYEARGWESPLFEPFLRSRVRHQTIEAMWEAIAAGVGRIREYIDAKKQILGIEDFRWYDQSAPLGEVTRTYPYPEATDFVTRHLAGFSEELGEFARMAIERRWVEAEDRSGKAAGGFCTGFPVAGESRIFMTYSGNYTEMMTLAHELGHAYHSWVLRDKDYYGRHYTMTLAETASTFNEMLVTDAALDLVDDPRERLSLVDRKLQEHLAMFCNIRARYLFEAAFYDERKRGPVPRERLNELMFEAQREAFGGMLAEDGYHPLFWASKLHFSETGVPFYNFPYTFGHLFAGGIYDRAKKEGSTFAKKYKALLIDTGGMTCEDLARRHLDVDLAAGGFWKDAVARALKDVDVFLGLKDQVGA